MCDDDACASRHYAAEGFLDQRFGFAVEVAGGFVEGEDLWV